MSKIKPNCTVLHLPAGYFGMVLGTIGMGFAWRYASTIWPVSHWVGDSLVLFAIALWVFLTLALMTRLIRFPYSIINEMYQPISSNFFSLFPATTLLVSIGLAPWHRTLALVLFAIGVTLQLAYASWLSAGSWRGRYPREATTPGLYLPTVANNFISAMACAAFGFQNVAVLFLGAGAFSWLSLEPAILQRLRSAGELPVEQRSSLGIQLAPALVACNAWLAINGGQADVMAKMLFGYGLLQLLFMLRLMPWFLRASFSASFWSFSFGISALAATALHLGHADSGDFFDFLAIPLFIFTNAITGLLIVCTLYLLFSGKLLTRVEPSALQCKKESDDCSR